MQNFKVTLERDGKRIIVIMRSYDYAMSIRYDRGSNAKMKYGSGKMWNIYNCEAA